MKFIRNYRQLLTNGSFVSKTTSFLLVVFVLSELSQSLYAYIFEAESGWINTNWNKIIVYVFFSLLITVIFTGRFILLWAKSPKGIWSSQLAWLAGWLTILSYHLITNKILHDGYFENRKDFCLDCYDAFLWYSNALVIFLMAYIIFSPIKQFLVLISALISRYNIEQKKLFGVN